MMNDTKICPICSTENSNKLEKCRQCGFSLTPIVSEDSSWLDNLRAENKHHEESPVFSDSEPSEQTSTLSDHDDLPDWMVDRHKNEPHEPFDPIQENIPFSLESTNPFTNDPDTEDRLFPDRDEAIPDWLTQMRNDPELIEEDVPAQSDEDLPDWLKNAPIDTEINDFEKIESQEAESDWLQDLAQLNQESETEKPAQKEPDEEAETSGDRPFTFVPEPLVPSEFIIPPFSDPAPDEQAEVDKTPGNSSPFSESEPKNDSAAPMPEQQPKTKIPYETPFELDEQQDASPFTAEPTPTVIEQSALEKSALPFTFDELPDWLEDIDKVKNEENEEFSASQSSTSAEKLQPGSLPGWLKAMRPVSAVAPSEIRKEDHRRVEKSGPLAGLQGVLSQETAVNHYTAPPTYASKVNVTDKNKLHTHLLEEVFSTEKIQKPKIKSRLDYTLIRLVLPILLILVLVFSSFNSAGQDGFNNSPRNLPAIQFASIANSLSTTLTDAPRLLMIMDSDAASMGELQLVTQTALETFMIQNAWLVIIGTNPSGLLVSDQIINHSIRNVPSYNGIERVIQLGYLPGNETGIQGFISNPKLMLQQQKNGSSIWDNPGLKNISQINDFDSIWIISDNAESTQKWIEQLQSSHTDIPLLISAATQATPMLTTYLNAGQFDGLIGGLPGAITYHQVTTKSPAAFEQTWHLYQALIFAFLLIILAGFVFQSIEKVFQSKRK